MIYFILIFLVRPRNPRSNEHPYHPDCDNEIPFNTEKYHAPWRTDQFHNGRQKMSRISLEHSGKPEIKEVGSCQMNLRANLKRLQMAKDGTICASLKITSAMNWIILNMFKLISSQWFFKQTNKKTPAGGSWWTNSLLWKLLNKEEETSPYPVSSIQSILLGIQRVDEGKFLFVFQLIMK